MRTRKNAVRVKTTTPLEISPEQFSINPNSGFEKTNYRKSILGLFASLTLGLSLQTVSAEQTDMAAFNDFTPKIVGGEEATPGEFPFMVSLRRYNQHWCGGSVVDDHYILTAAHCTSGASASQLQVTMGLHHQSNQTGTQTLQVTEVINHPNYNSGTMANDIALLKVDQPIASSYDRIELADASDVYAGRQTTVIGWGRLSEGGTSSSTLQKVNVPMVSLATCRSAYGTGSIHEHNVCAGLAEGGKDSCQGDSGGPLFVEQNGSFRQLGIVSWGEGCARPNRYGVYTGVHALSSWIQSHTGGSDNGDPDGVTPISNGVPASNLNGASGSMAYFVMDVPHGAKDLKFAISGGSGDADLYVKAGSKPTLHNYDCRPYIGGNNESCSLDATAGKYYVMLYGFSSYSDVSLTGQYQGGDSIVQLQNGQTLGGLSGAKGDSLYFKLDVPSGASTLNVDIQGGSGDADLYVGFNAKPNDDNFVCRPYQAGNNEFCTTSANAGTWYIMVKGYNAFSGLSLTARYQ